MSILATRVGRLATPTAPGQTVCWRCGHTFNRSAENVIPGAPCRDCRDVEKELEKLLGGTGK